MDNWFADHNIEIWTAIRCTRRNIVLRDKRTSGICCKPHNNRSRCIVPVYRQYWIITNNPNMTWFFSPFKASAHSFKRFTSPPFLKLTFSLSMHLLPRMNAMLDFIWTLPVQQRGTRNKWTLQKNHRRIRTLTGKDTSLQVHRLNCSANSRLLWMKKLNVHLMPVNMYIYTIYK